MRQRAIYFSLEQIIQFLINPAPPTNHELIPLQYGLLLASSPSPPSLNNAYLLPNIGQMEPFYTFYSREGLRVAFPFHYSKYQSYNIFRPKLH